MRKSIELSDNWLFSKTCTAAPAALPVGWEKVSIPHSWNAVDGHDGSQFDRGAYWYVTAFHAPAQPLPGGRCYVEIGAAGLVGEIWVNGRFITRHVGGYSAFRGDVTDALVPGENILAVLCDNTYSDKVYPQRADFTFYGGLYRHVKLLSVPATRFTLDDFGGSGVYIDTTRCGSGAMVQVRALLDGVCEGQTVGVQIIDAGGNVVSEAWGIAEGETILKTFIPDVRLWDGPDGANLYTAKLQILSYNEVVDEISQDFGVRDFRIDKETGFWLNGRSHPLRGVCRHQDRLYIGPALSREQHFEDAKIIAEMGANTIRLAHYQQSHHIYEACDRLGLVVWAEIPYFPVSWDDDAHAAAVNEIREMVIQNYNHPSICFWGLSNEVLMGGREHEKLMPCHIELQKTVKSIDPNRLTVIAHEYTHPWDHPLQELSDAQGWNHYFGWYRGSMEELAAWCDRYHAAYPERLLAISEYGCDAILGYHTDTPAKMDYTEEYQVRIHENACETFAARPWIWGSFVWNMFDFGSGFRREGGTRGRNNKGLVTMDRKVRKDSFYVYKAWYGREPFVHIDGRRYFARPYRNAEIRIHSNQREVALYADGQLIGRATGEHVFVFENVPLSPEGTVLTARAGDCTDTITLYAVDEKPARFTFPDFKRAQDARNWFDSLEEVAGTLETRPGYYSVHDSMGEIKKNPVTRDIFLDCITAGLERSLIPDRILGGDSTVSAADAMSVGFLAQILGKQKESILRKLHAALSQVPKP